VWREEEEEDDDDDDDDDLVVYHSTKYNDHNCVTVALHNYIVKVPISNLHLVTGYSDGSVVFRSISRRITEEHLQKPRLVPTIYDHFSVTFYCTSIYIYITRSLNIVIT
jgi:hypothetical protein